MVKTTTAPVETAGEASNDAPTDSGDTTDAPADGGDTSNAPADDAQTGGDTTEAAAAADVDVDAS